VSSRPLIAPKAVSGVLLDIKIAHLNRVLHEHIEDLERGEFLVVTPGRIGCP
jgi:hypothetical protein